MSTESGSSRASPLLAYQQAWAASMCEVLEQLAATRFSFEVLDAEAPEAGTGVWVRFAASGSLAGEQAFHVPRGDAVRLAQVLGAELPDEAAEFTAERREALERLFRQFAGSAVTAWKARVDGKVALEFRGGDQPGWLPAVQAGLRLAGATITPFHIQMQINEEMAAALRRAPSAAPTMAVLPGGAPAAGKLKGPAYDTNVELLMDLELEVTLRFGERQLPLRDILQLGPGAVVELDRQVQEPADLLVAGKLIARGEVVIVDGNYGLRVSEIVSPRQRIESLGR